MMHIMGMYLSVYVCPTVRPTGLMSVPAVDRGPVPEHQWDRRRHLGESSPTLADYSPSGLKPRWSQNYEGGTLPTSSPACNHNIQILTFRHTTYELCAFCDPMNFPTIATSIDMCSSEWNVSTTIGRTAMKCIYTHVRLLRDELKNLKIKIKNPTAMPAN